MNIELEDTATLKAWLEEFNRPGNEERITLSNCIYNYHEIVRELLKRDFIEGVMEDLGK